MENSNDLVAYRLMFLMRARMGNKIEEDSEFKEEELSYS